MARAIVIKCRGCGRGLRFRQLRQGGCPRCRTPIPRQEIRAAYGGNPAWLILPYRGALISSVCLIGVWIVNAVRAPVNFDVGFLLFMVSYVVLATFVARAYVLLDQTRMGMLYLLMTLGCFPALPFLVIGMAVRCAHVFYRFGIPFGLFGTARETVERFLEDRCCRQCGYDLTGNVSGRCPECGMVVSTDNAPASRHEIRGD